MGEIVFEIDGVHFNEYLLAQRHCAHNQLDANLIEKVELKEGEVIFGGKIGKGIFTQCGHYYLTFEEAEADAYGEVVHGAVLEEGQEIVDKKIVTREPVGGEIVFKIDGTYFYDTSAAAAHARMHKLGGGITEVELKAGQKLVGGRLVSDPVLYYDVEIGVGVVIPFWDNFEAAKDCVAAINKRAYGGSARIVSFVLRREVGL